MTRRPFLKALYPMFHFRKDEDHRMSRNGNVTADINEHRIWDPAEYHENIALGVYTPTIRDRDGEPLIFDFSGKGVEMSVKQGTESLLFDSDHLDMLELIVAKLKTEVGD